MTVSTRRRIALLERQIGHDRPLSDEEVLRAMERGRDRARAKRLAERSARQSDFVAPPKATDSSES